MAVAVQTVLDDRVARYVNRVKEQQHAVCIIQNEVCRRKFKTKKAAL